MPACRRCRGQLISDAHVGEEICQACGMVSKDKIESPDSEYYSNSDYRHAFEGKGSPKYHGPLQSLLHYDSGADVIPHGPTDYLRQPVKEENKRIFKRSLCARKTRSERFRVALDYIRKMSEQLLLQKQVAERAAYMCRHAAGKSTVQARFMAAACIYLACIWYSLGENLGLGGRRKVLALEDLAQAAGISMGAITRLQTELGVFFFTQKCNSK